MFLDETWAKTNMARRYGRCAKGRRLVAAVPHGHWKTTTFLAALRHDRIVAPCVLDGAINGRRFVVMDNVSSHRVAGVKAAIEAAGASLCRLPPYSPDFNPIEQVFAKLKAILRRIAARTRDNLWDAIGTALSAFTPQECRNYIIHSGYSG